MFVVTESEAAAVRAAFNDSGEFSTAIELRRHYPGITDNAKARECARIIAGWKPIVVPAAAAKVVQLRPKAKADRER